MCKREVIDEILRINTSAKPAFLADFSLEDLQAYLHHLRAAQTPRPLACLYATSAVHAGACAADAAGEDLGAEYPQEATLF